MLRNGGDPMADLIEGYSQPCTADSGALSAFYQPPSSPHDSRNNERRAQLIGSCPGLSFTNAWWGPLRNPEKSLNED
jgi:hypothetical protein